MAEMPLHPHAIAPAKTPRTAPPKNHSDPLPSRFLDELQLAPTVQVMGALQRLAAGEDDAAALLRSVQRFSGVRKVVKHLTAEYLKDVGDKVLSGEVTRIAAARLEVPFAYRFAFTPPTIPTTQPQPSAVALHRAWERVAF
ncbi:MAG: hypothetical protein ACP5J4_17865 [Anaerolineae bacterium]